MEKKYVKPHTHVAFVSVPTLLAGTATDGNTLNSNNRRQNGDAGNAASRGGSVWDDGE